MTDGELPVSARFEGVMGGKGNKARIEVAPAVIEQLQAGHTPDARVTVNGFEYTWVIHR